MTDQGVSLDFGCSNALCHVVGFHVGDCPMKRNAPVLHNRTPNHECPACIAGKMHTPEQWKEFHPHAGEGSNAH